MALHPEAAPTDITKLCGEGWKKLSEEGRRPYLLCSMVVLSRTLELLCSCAG